MYDQLIHQTSHQALPSSSSPSNSSTYQTKNGYVHHTHQQPNFPSALCPCSHRHHPPCLHLSSPLGCSPPRPRHRGTPPPHLRSHGLWCVGRCAEHATTSHSRRA